MPTMSSGYPSSEHLPQVREWRGEVIHSQGATSLLPSRVFEVFSAKCKFIPHVIETEVSELLFFVPVEDSGIPIAHYVSSTAFPPQGNRSPDKTSSLLARYRGEGREPEPSPSCNPVRNVRAVPIPCIRPFTRGSKASRLLTRSRNTQTAKSIQPIQNSCKRKKFTCDVCGYVQRNRRMPDFRRHLNTHTKTFEDNAQKGRQCKGVLRSVRRMCQVMFFMDEERVGGCCVVTSSLRFGHEYESARCFPPQFRQDTGPEHGVVRGVTNWLCAHST
ncbi:hypothetical protein R3P38DRAFT_3001357 [Favolaschia claudopus]|uniref:C2H2-type domain-containing protein n=1 Tax=Favolaschia claudopus TaxID=2862362 RepID=A0AAV9Z4G2_9AGAR